MRTTALDDHFLGEEERILCIILGPVMPQMSGI